MSLLSELQMMQAEPAEVTLTVLNQALSCQRKYRDQSASPTLTLRPGCSREVEGRLRHLLGGFF